MIPLSGVTIHDPDVVLTDLGLAILGGYLAWRLSNMPGQRTMLQRGAILMGGLAGAALWGAIFHAFFPAGTATLPGFLAWVPVTLSIVVAASAMLDLGLRLLLPRIPLRLRQITLIAYGVSFTVVVLFVRESFGSIVYFYFPVLLLLLVAAGRQGLVRRTPGWTMIAAGLMVSAVAAVLQQSGVSIHPIYFDHNAVYHVVQALALIFIYQGWKRAPLPIFTT